MPVPLMTRAFKLKAATANFNAPAHTRTNREHILGFKAEFMLTNPTHHQAPKTLGAITRKLEAMVQEKGVLKACEFALEEFRQTRQTPRSIFHYKASEKSYQDTIITFIVGQKDNLVSLNTRADLDKVFDLLSDVKNILETYPLYDGRNKHQNAQGIAIIGVSQVEVKLDNFSEDNILNLSTGRPVAQGQFLQPGRREVLGQITGAQLRLVT